jgi:hypothetical protein
LGNNKLKNRTGLNIGELKKITAMWLEVYEIKQNITKQYRNGGRMVKPAVHEGRKKGGKQEKDTSWKSRRGRRGKSRIGIWK